MEVNILLRERNPYSYGSTAEKINQELYYQKQLFVAKKKKQKQNALYKVRVTILVLAVFACLSVVAIQYAEISKISYSVNSLGNEYERLSNENTIMAVKIDSAMNLENLRQKARQDLGMIKPGKNNIIYVNVPKQNSKNSNAYANINTGNVAENIINQISRLLGFVK
jgi:cell division protein FtsB